MQKVCVVARRMGPKEWSEVGRVFLSRIPQSGSRVSCSCRACCACGAERVIYGALSCAGRVSCCSAPLLSHRVSRLDPPAGGAGVPACVPLLPQRLLNMLSYVCMLCPCGENKLCKMVSQALYLGEMRSNRHGATRQRPLCHATPKPPRPGIV